MFARTLADRLEQHAAVFPAVLLTGPRQSGKTTLARTSFPDFLYINLEDTLEREEARDDPPGFLRRLEGARGAILDEVQRVPQLFSALQVWLDERDRAPLVLTGSHQVLMGQGVSQSLAGRVSILELLPLSVAELAGRPGRDPEQLDALEPGPSPPGHELDELLFRGLYPRLHDRELPAAAWLDAYVRTYVERDVRTLRSIGDLDTFGRFLRLCAGRSGQLLNYSALASDAGVSQPTAKQWVSLLRASYLIDVVQPHHERLSKRLVRTPKLYFTDTGVLCSLLGIREPTHLRSHPLRGAVFETFVMSELRKVFTHRGERAPLYFWRDRQGHEVDAVVELGHRRVAVEAKSGVGVPTDAFRGLAYYRALTAKRAPDVELSSVLVHGGDADRLRGEHLVRPWWAVS